MGKVGWFCDVYIYDFTTELIRIIVIKYDPYIFLMGLVTVWKRQIVWNSSLLGSSLLRSAIYLPQVDCLLPTCLWPKLLLIFKFTEFQSIRILYGICWSSVNCVFGSLR